MSNIVAAILDSFCWFCEFLFLVGWIVVLVFAFDIDCSADPLNARPWLLIAAFSHLLVMISTAFVSWLTASWSGMGDVFKRYRQITLTWNAIQIIWFAIGIKLLTSLDSCLEEWVPILGVSLLSLVVLRIPILITVLIFISE